MTEQPGHKGKAHLCIFSKKIQFTAICQALFIAKSFDETAHIFKKYVGIFIVSIYLHGHNFIRNVPVLSFP